MTTNRASLEDWAEEFASELTRTLTGVLGPTCPGFVAEASPRSGPRQRVSIHTTGSEAISLLVDGEHRLSLVAEFECAWDHQSAYLAVRRATFKVSPARKGAPLFRYEFVEDMAPAIPSAHLHVHAHRDEFLFALFRGGHGKPALRAQAVLGTAKRAEPQLSDVHFPLGGPRMRPCIEDVLQMLHVEFAIDVEGEFQQVLDEGRARWRRRQLGAAVRDAPGEAVRVLTEMGYSVADPEDGPWPERRDKLTRM